MLGRSMKAKENNTMEDVRSLLLFLCGHNIHPFNSGGLPTSKTLAELVEPLLTYPPLKNSLSSKKLSDFDLFDWCPSRVEASLKIGDVRFPGIVIAVPKAGEDTPAARAGEVKLRALSEEGEKMKIKPLVEKQIEVDRMWGWRAGVPNKKEEDILELKPNIWGLGVNLKALARRISRFFSGRR